ncbi:venom allergen 3-like isoform X1 [Thrips palmi]|uniref:Venom allergen 3-like isoform X1 n=1 Tax=Thrips palmi TaxID=161013 RepID=A0A6P8YL03_THRPL|nr:venom allergen 3-like isoform X1 [Thrips palmi]XP_034237731.1 venom allergen 3-like isoform X1 [Thrips palmi]
MLRLFVLVAVLGVAAAATDYCKLCPDHVMCKYPSASPGKACKNYKKPTISASDKELIVRLHNEYRNKVALGQEKRGKNNPQPSASNMRKISWDDEIATYAQRWADQCTFEHDTCHTTKDGTVSGQNLLLGGLAPNQTKPDWTAAVKIWYEEVKDRDGSLNTKPFKFQCGSLADKSGDRSKAKRVSPFA